MLPLPGIKVHPESFWFERYPWNNRKPCFEVMIVLFLSLSLIAIFSSPPQLPGFPKTLLPQFRDIS